MNLGAVDHFFETLGSRWPWRGCPICAAGPHPQSPRQQPVGASAIASSPRSLRSGRPHAAPRHRGEEWAVENAEGIARACWESSSDRRWTFVRCGPLDDRREDRSVRTGAVCRAIPFWRGSIARVQRSRERVRCASRSIPRLGTPCQRSCGQDR